MDANLSHGLIRSSLAVALSENISFDEFSPSIEQLFYNKNNKQYGISWLPEGSEPGPWAMQVNREDEG